MKKPKLCRCCAGHDDCLNPHWHRCSVCGETCRCAGCREDSAEERNS